MPSVRSPLAFFIGASCLLGADPPAPRVAPIYTAASIVNAADNQSGVLAPNTLATIYGANMAYSTATIALNDLQGGVLPTVLGASETQVFVGGYPADLYYVSPTQINFLVPPNMLALAVLVYVTIDSLKGPEIPITLAPAAPGLFQLDLTNAVATRADGSVLTPGSPAQPGSIAILWATGLGETNPRAIYGQIPEGAAPLVVGSNLSILLDGLALDPHGIAYAGQAPGFAGLYQINFTLPTSTCQDPEIRLQMGSAISIAGVHLLVASKC